MFLGRPYFNSLPGHACKQPSGQPGQVVSGICEPIMFLRISCFLDFKGAVSRYLATF